jgi:hypothetical protein
LRVLTWISCTDSAAIDGARAFISAGKRLPADWRVRTCDVRSATSAGKSTSFVPTFIRALCRLITAYGSKSYSGIIVLLGNSS